MGDYAGRARYLPGDARALTAKQRSAIGRIVEVNFMGLASTGSEPGESLYQELAGHDVIGPTLIRECDLDFIPDPTTARK